MPDVILHKNINKLCAFSTNFICCATECVSVMKSLCLILGGMYRPTWAAYPVVLVPSQTCHSYEIPSNKLG